MEKTRKTLNLIALAVFLSSNFLTPLSYAVDDLGVIRDETAEIGGEMEQTNAPQDGENVTSNDYSVRGDNEKATEYNEGETPIDFHGADAQQSGVNSQIDSNTEGETPMDSYVADAMQSGTNSQNDGNKGDETVEDTASALDVMRDTVDNEVDEQKLELDIVQENLNSDLIIKEETFDDLGITEISDLTDTQAWVEGEDFETISIRDPANPGSGFTIMDRNLGAENAIVSTTYNVIANTGSYGFKYQWGNNYGFEDGCASASVWNGCSDAVTSSRTTTLAIWNGAYANHGYYGNNKFIYNTNGSDYWTGGLHYDNLRGGQSDGSGNNRGANQTNPTDRQGPCPVNYHVPSAGEWSMLLKYWRDNKAPNVNLWGSGGLYYTNDSTVGTNFMTYFKLPLVGFRSSGGGLLTQGLYGRYWSSSPNTSREARILSVGNGVHTDNGSDYRTRALSVRCFKDVYEAPTTYTLTFVSNGGSPVASQTVMEGETWSIPANPTKTGGMFEGWYTSTGYTLAFDFSDPATENKTAYAKWHDYEEYPITYENTLQAENNNPTSYYEITSNISLANLYKNAHTKFEGWYTDEEYQNKVKGVAIPQGSTGARTFYAKWSCKGGSTREGDECVFHGTTATLITGADFNMALKSLAKGSSVTNPSTSDDLIKGFVWRDSLPNGVAKIKISTDEDSDVPVWAWLDTAGYRSGGIVYYTSEADKIYMNPNAVNMFNNMQALTSLDLSNLDTSLTTQMHVMFQNCINLKSLNLDNWDLSKLSSYGGSQFNNATSLKTISARNWILPQSASYMLSNRGPSLTANLDWIDVSGWDLSKTNSISALFAQNKAKEIRGLSTWDTSNITDMTNTFNSCSNLTELDISNWDTSVVTNMYQIFSSCSNLTELDLSNWDTSNVLDVSYMFNNCTSLKSLNLDNWDLSNISYYPKIQYMFNATNNLKTLSLKNWTISEEFTHMLGCRNTQLCANLDRIDVSNWDLSKTKNINGLFGASNAYEIRGLDTWDTSNITNMAFMFQNSSNIISLDINNWDTSNVRTMDSMFNSSYNLVSLDLSNWNTSKVEFMSSMFNGCTNLKSLNLDNWDLSSLTSYGGMFGSSNSLKMLSLKNWTIPTTFRNVLGSLSAQSYWVDVSDWDLSKAEDLMGLFKDAQTKEIRGLDTWDTSNITNMGEMFKGCTNLTSINGMDKWDTSKVTNMEAMFQDCSNLTSIDVSTWDTSSVESMYAMFAGCTNIASLDFSNWDTCNVEDMTYMFAGANALRTIYASEKFVTTKVTDVVNSMFAFTDLVGGQGTAYEYEHAGTDYAKIDGGTNNPGYFTQSSRITYNLDGGELQKPTKTAYSPLKKFTLAEPTKEGYTFLGWTGSNGNVPKKEVTIQQGTQGDLEFTANWEINNYQIIFDVDGGDAIDPMEVEYNSSLEGLQLPTPTKEGYKFVGWNGLPETMPAEDITIMASWEQVSKGSSSSGGGGGSKVSPIDVVEKTVDDNTHKAADEKDESKTPDGKGGSSDSSDAASVEANYSQEFVEAYDFAKSNGITTQPSIQKAKMNSPLTRIAMAKMLSYYAMNVLGQEPDMSKTINFDDVSAKRDAEYDNGVTLAYQLGIMGINMKNNRFRPNDEVTRAEFVTALSRMIYGMRDGTGKMKYYEPHMARLYNEGIINETNPKMKEKRGYVMIMLMRTVK